MAERVVWSTFEAAPGREAEVIAILRDCRDGISRERGNTALSALEIGPGLDATFAAFADEDAFEAHVAGPTADAVRGRAAVLSTAQPAVVQAAVIATKAGTRGREGVAPLRHAGGDAPTFWQIGDLWRVMASGPPTVCGLCQLE